MDRINNILLSDFGALITTGTEELLEMPERKEVIENDWAEENGNEYLLANPKFKDKEVTLKCAILADNSDDFWKFYNALFVELSKPQQTLYIDDHSKTYNVFYKKSGNFKKVLKRLKNVVKVFVKFELTFKVLYN